MSEILIINSVSLWAIVLLNLLLTIALIRRINKVGQTEPQRAHESSRLKVGEPAPMFSGLTLKNEPATLSNYKGQRTVFLFISPACGPCREALPKYEAVAPKALRAGIEIVLVSIANVEQTRAFVQEMNIRLPIIATPIGSNILTDDFGFRGTPSFCLVDTEGKVELSGHPSFEWGDWKRLVYSWETSTPYSSHPLNQGSNI